MLMGRPKAIGSIRSTSFCFAEAVERSSFINKESRTDGSSEIPATRVSDVIGQREGDQRAARTIGVGVGVARQSALGRGRQRVKGRPLSGAHDGVPGRRSKGRWVAREGAHHGRNDRWRKKKRRPGEKDDASCASAPVRAS